MFAVDIANNLIKTSVRPSFNQRVINAFQASYVPRVTDYCHSISADAMQSWIYEIITNFRINATQKAAELQNLAIALRTPPGVNVANLPPSTSEDTTINNLCGAVSVNAQAQFANQLYTEFFNEINNLRAGSFQWNRAIKENYDPTSWIHIDGNGNVDFYNNPPVVPANLPPGARNCFFLTDDQDNRRLSNLMNVNNVMTPIGIFSNWGHSKGNPIPFVCSSDNDFWIDSEYNLPRGDSIYFYNYNTRRWKRC